MDKRFEQEANGEPLGIPADLFMDPAKYDGDIPLWKRTVGFVKQYEKSKPKGRDTLLEQLASFAIKDLSSVDKVIDNFGLIGSSRPNLNIDEIKGRFVTLLENSASRHSTLSTWTPDQVEQLIQVSLDSSVDCRQAFRCIQRGMFNAPRNVDEAVNLFYNATWAMVQSDDFEVKKHLFSVLCLEQKDIITESSMSVWLAEFGLASPNDAILSRYSGYIRALRSVGILIEAMTNGSASSSSSQRCKARDKKLKDGYKNLLPNQKVELQRISLDFKQKNPQRVEQLIALSESGIDAPPIEFVSAQGLADQRVEEALKRRRHVPTEYDNLAIDPKDPLSLLVKERINPFVVQLDLAKTGPQFAAKGYQRLLERSLELPQGLELQVFAKDVTTPEQKTELVREVYSAFSTGKAVNPNRALVYNPHELVEYTQQYLGATGYFDQDKKIVFMLQRPLPIERLGSLGGILEYHRPAIALEQMGYLNEQSGRLRQDLLNRFTKSVGRRGYEIVFSDPVLRQFGYESMLFKQSPDKKDLKVTITINGQSYEFELDAGYRTILGEDNLKKFKSFQDQAWLELLTLSHLKKVTCTGEDEEELKQELLGGEKQYGLYRKQQVDRIEHLRRQAPGRNFTTESFGRCLKSHLPMRNLYEINRLRAGINLGGTLQTGIWTYVSGVEKDIDTQTAKPVKVAFKGASDDIRQVIPLGEVSTEELNRLEKEILDELEV
ncbi:hypothetical protein A3J19_01190 [Candidatus Daviesbacteria bacterium RIFCSPLOWO2_02_FULL_41_8]|uniref:Uncharacterized protein n=3 Tax=Patescibacteria group TaxID=1783273 RepID=A0A1F5NKL6_9BACT|nr:MAG: hypothetical protein A2871_02950 [Candidatus Daviesbacteria bacterium RIFCSPHIGHO2_01_FULL_41_23]OGE78074.1 MAG: hypothetical protein A3J19_01190 [Candidatus Daviesbacteria bacterium RIFCSPLOWO2_02_FULL_41_8]OGZ39316.1 MAG: hypothetical protein A3E90_01325 [Candidatus Portnoybacteria bacterium RIFCSPHIGHO2_12_FULL_40_11]